MTPGEALTLTSLGAFVRVQVAAAVRRKSEVTDPVCSIESPTQQIAASPDMSRPGRDYVQ